MFNDAFSWMRPPFNTISRFRNPGKVNWNMMSDARVWQSLTWSFPDPNTSTSWNIWNSVKNSRRGYAAEARSDFATVDIFTDRVNFDGNLNPDYPTQFHGAFSSALTSTRDSTNYDQARDRSPEQLAQRRSKALRRPAQSECSMIPQAHYLNATRLPAVAANRRRRLNSMHSTTERQGEGFGQ